MTFDLRRFFESDGAIERVSEERRAGREEWRRTTAPAAMVTPSPIVVGERIFTPPPIHTSSPIVTSYARSYHPRRSSTSTEWVAQ